MKVHEITRHLENKYENYGVFVRYNNWNGKNYFCVDIKKDGNFNQDIDDYIRKLLKDSVVYIFYLDSKHRYYSYDNSGKFIERYVIQNNHMKPV